jgi:hypothetical protein
MYRHILKKISAIPLFSTLLISCKTIDGAVPPDPEAVEYREIQGDLHRQQLDLAITGNDRGGKSTAFRRFGKNRGGAIFPEGGDQGDLLPQIKALRVIAEDHERNAGEVNRQLAVERETNWELSKKFDAYDVTQNKALSEIAGEIAVLEVENKKVKGQRNTLLAIIIITAIVALVLFIVFTVLPF